MIYSGKKQCFCKYCDHFFQKYLQDLLGIKVFKFKIECQQLQIKQYGIDIIINQIDYCHFIKSINISKKEILSFDKRRIEKLENANWVNELARPDILLAC